MIPATQEQIEAACMTRSAPDAVAFLVTAGVQASTWACTQAIRDLVESGKRAKRIDGRSPDIECPEAAAEMSCRVFLRRLLEAGHHHISDPARMAAALREAGMVSA